MLTTVSHHYIVQRGQGSYVMNPQIILGPANRWEHIYLCMCMSIFVYVYICLLCVPPISKMCANSFFDRSFVYAAPTLWNALDLEIRLLPFDAFKKRVKTHLYLKNFSN